MLKEKNDPIEQEIQNLDRRVIYIMIAGAIILIAMPILVTQLNWFLDFSKTETGVIGDTIGGITSPVIGVISALLIYFSFRAQVNANRIIQKQITEQKKDENEKKDHNYQMEIYNHLKELIDNFEFITFQASANSGERFGISSSKLFGPTAILEYIKRLIQVCKDKKGMVIDVNYFHSYGYLEMNEKNYISFLNVIALFTFLIDRIEKSLEDDFDVLLIVTLTKLQFYNRIWSFVENEINESINDNQIEQGTSSAIYGLLHINHRLQSLDFKR